jgi:hypothetical protein
MGFEATEIEDRLLKAVVGLTANQRKELLDFALFLQARQVQEQPPQPTPRPVQRLEELFGDFWPEDQSVDDFVATVRQWRREDIDLHTDLP